MRKSRLTVVVVNDKIWTLVRPVWFGGGDPCGGGSVSGGARDRSGVGSEENEVERPARRLIVGHADLIDEGWPDQLAEAWRRERVQV